MDLRKIFRSMLGLKDRHIRQAISVHQLGQPIRSTFNYEGFAKEGYQNNVIAFRAIKGIADAAKNIKWLLFQKTLGGDKIEIDNHPLIDLLKRPNPMQGHAPFIENLISYYFISGNAFVHAVGPSDTAPPTELFSPRPDRMKIVPGRFGFPSFYQFMVGNNTIKFPVDQVSGKSSILHLKMFNPLDDWRGMSPIRAASFSIDQHNESNVWNLALLQNKATPSGVVAVTVSEQNPSGKLDDNEYNKLKRQIADRYEGAENAGRPLLLEGGLEWKSTGFSPSDMDWITGKNTSAREVSLALGYPPILLNIQGDTTFSNVKEARLALYEETVLPTLDFIVNEFNHWLVPAFGDNLFFDIDRDTIDALAVKRQIIFDKVNTATFLTTNEKRSMTGFEDDPNGDVILVPAGLIPLELAVGSDTESEDEDLGLDDEDENTSHEDEDVDKSINNLFKNIETKHIEAKNGEVRFFDFVRRWVDIHTANKITNIYGSTQKKVVKAIRLAAIDQLETGAPLETLVSDIQKNVSKVYSGFTKTRSRLIARTETSIASNEGSRGAAKALNIPNMIKEWLSALDDRTRGSSFSDATNHVIMNGVKVEIDEKFLVPSKDGDDEMDGPGDNLAPIDQLANCRCVLVYSKDTEKNFNLPNQAAKRRFWLAQVRKRSTSERRFAAQLKAVFRKELIELKSALSNIADAKLAELTAISVFDETRKDMERVLKSNYENILKQFGQDVLKII